MLEYKVIDAKDKILGRLCSQVAKKALLGERIVVINAKDAIISGNQSDIHEQNLAKLRIRSHYNPTRGPFHDRRPDTYMRRVIKQMLPRKKIRGKDAIKRVHIYIQEIPERFKYKYQKLVPEQIYHADKSRLSYYNKFITLENLCVRIGWNKKEFEA